MRSISLILSVLALIVPALADVRDCQNLYRSGPKSLGGYALTQGSDLEKNHRGDGYSLQYGKSDGNRATLFFYDAGKRRIKNSHIPDEFGRSFKSAIDVQAIALAKRGATEITFVPVSNADMAVEFEESRNGTTFAKGQFHMRAKGLRLLNDYLIMAKAGNCFVKMRMTIPGTKISADRTFEKIWLEMLSKYGG